MRALRKGADPLSWSKRFTIKPGQTVREVITAEAVADVASQIAENARPAAVESIELSVDFAEKVVDAIGFGADGDREVAVTLSGHANAGHQPAAGWADDSVNVYVSQVMPEQQAEAASAGAAPA